MSKQRVTASAVSARKVCDWRETLLDHARELWSEKPGASLAVLTKRDTRARAKLEPVLGDISGEALALVSDCVRGARQMPGAGKCVALPPQVLDRLTIVTRGVASMLEEPEKDTAKESPLVIQLELWQLLRKVRESGELAYAREVDLIDLDRRMLLLLYNHGPAVPADIASSVGVDKAQVSRSVKRLLELHLISRKQIRSPLRLTAEGEKTAERLERLSELRNRELTFEIDDAELAEFFRAIRILLERAIVLYEQERDNMLGLNKSARIEEPVIHGIAGSPLDRTRIIFPLLTLSSYFGRSGALTFKRLTGLSKFEAFVLQEIGRHPPVEWGALVASLRRDHSQAGRTVNALLERGLIRREGKPGRRHGRFYPTREGQKVCRVLNKTSLERSSFLLAPLSPIERERFFASLAKIRRNARAQLERERAIAQSEPARHETAEARAS